MTRACNTLTLLLVAFGGSLLVTSPARCQLGFDYNHYGPCYREACPFADGNVQTDEEAMGAAHTDGLIDDVDLRGRMVVAILDDPVAMDASDAEEALAADSETADMRASSEPVESVSSSDEMTDVYNYGYRYEYLLKHGYIHHDDPAYGATCCPAGAPGAIETAEAAPEVVRDCENEVYQAYLQRCAEEAVANALVVTPTEPADQAAPYDPYGYEYRGGESAGSYAEDPADAVIAETAPAEVSEPRLSAETMDAYAPYKPYEADNVPSYGRHSYGYGYGYDYEYHREYGSYQQPDQPAESHEAEADTTSDIDLLQLINLGRESLRTLLESGFADMAREKAEWVWIQVAQTADAIDIDQIRHDATEALTHAIQQPLPAPHDMDWTDANVYVFTFDSEPDAERATGIDSEQTPSMVETETIQAEVPDEQDAAAVAPAEQAPVSTDLPIHGEVARQWTHRIMTSLADGLDRCAVALRHFAPRNVATVPSDHPSSTTQR